MTATVSVIIPTFNRRAYVQEAIDSVLAQTYTGYEIIVIDDGSTDGTGEALRERYGDKIVYEWQENQGESVARNRGIALAQGEYIAFLDSDDLWLPEKLEKQVAYLGEHPEVGAVFAESWVIDAAGQKLGDDKASNGITAEDLSLQGLCYDDALLLPSSAVFRQTALQRAGGFDTEIHHGEDYEFFARVRMVCLFSHLAEPLACHRRHGLNQSIHSAERNESQLQTHLLTASRVFRHWQDAPVGLRDRIVAWNYARFGIAQGAVGMADEMLTMLRQAAATDPGVLDEHERLAREAARNAVYVYGSSGDASGEIAVAYVKLVLRSLIAIGSRDRKLAREISATSCASIGFAAHRRGDMSTVRNTLSRALLLDRSLVRNAGAWSILFEATFGRWLSGHRRRCMVWLSGLRPIAGRPRVRPCE
jgi:hypothetical protein